MIVAGGTMMNHKHVIKLADVAAEKIAAPEGSPFGGWRKRVGVRVGAEKLGYGFFSVPPGKAAFPFHSHIGNEEMIYIIDGSGVLRFGEEDIPVDADTVIACPPGAEYPHQLINSGTRELRYLVVSTMAYPDLSDYPDSNKIGAYATAAGASRAGFRALYVKDANVGYYEGEEGKEIERIRRSAGPK